MEEDNEVKDDEKNKDGDEEVKDEREKLFSSDDFKIEVQNLPKYFGMGQLKKLFNNKLKLNTHKLKPCGPGKNYMYVCFKNSEDQARALDVLDGFDFKGSKLKVKQVKSSAESRDPYKKKQAEKVEDTRPISVRLQEATCPFAKDPYEMQLASKQNEVLTLVKRLGSEISQSCNPVKQWVRRRCDEFGSIAPIQNFIRSPLTSGYRNKCEFTIGYQSGEVAVGFRLASYKAGSVEVASLASLEDVEQTLPQISARMVKVVSRLEQLVKASPSILPYCTLTRTGNWRHLLLRSARGPKGAEEEGPEQVMAVVVVDPQQLSKEQLTGLREDLAEFFRTGAGSDAGVTSLFLHLSPARKEAGVPEPSPELLWGPSVIQEKLMGRTFNISPQAFFQVNTLGAELLYKTVGDIAELTKKTSLVDVCCGTGTIGLTLADRVGQVVGVEMVQEAVRDAIKNAEENKVTNCKFFAGKAEDILPNLLRDMDSKQVVAVVDPPRAGLHPRALSAIRNTEAIKRFVYVSCDAKNAMKNFVDIARPASKTALGDPFMPMKVIPVDLFPHSRGFELVILFERVRWGEILNSELDKRLKEEDKEGLNQLVSQAEQIKQEREGEKKEDTSKDENEIGENGNAIKKEESKRNDKDGD